MSVSPRSLFSAGMSRNIGDEEWGTSKERRKTLTLELIGWELAKGVAGFTGLIFYASFFEWVLHKYLMHMLLWRYPFQAHALIHHGLFRADSSYHLQRSQDEPKVTFAWWNAPLLVALHLPLLLSLGWLFGWAVFAGGLVAMVSDYMLYEYIHWCMHVPRDRWVERTRAFRFVNTHHYIHHRYPYQNLNVVNVLADWVIGTMRTAKEVDLTADPIVNPQAEQHIVQPIAAV